jgi:hypothetical protein
MAAANVARAADAPADEIPRRPLGKAGVRISALGVGGHHLGDMKTVEEAIGVVHEAIDAGVNRCLASRSAAPASTCRSSASAVSAWDARRP